MAIRKIALAVIIVSFLANTYYYFYLGESLRWLLTVIIPMYLMLVILPHGVFWFSIKNERKKLISVCVLVFLSIFFTLWLEYYVDGFRNGNGIWFLPLGWIALLFSVIGIYFVAEEVHETWVGRIKNEIAGLSLSEEMTFEEAWVKILGKYEKICFENDDSLDERKELFKVVWETTRRKSLNLSVD